MVLEFAWTTKWDHNGSHHGGRGLAHVICQPKNEQGWTPDWA